MTTEPEPSIKGSHAHAWRIHLDGSSPACVSSWLIECPHAHPFWSRWLLSVVHLRELEGAPEAVITSPGATHELLVAALDPDHAPFLDPVGQAFRVAGEIALLTPFDIVEQFAVPSDRHAAHLMWAAVLSVLNGEISPDRDYRRAWSGMVQAIAARLREAS